jgi:hypothetical protein
MAFRDLIPWSRQDNRLPVSVGAEQQQDAQMLSLLYFNRQDRTAHLSVLSQLDFHERKKH